MITLVKGDAASQDFHGAAERNRRWSYIWQFVTYVHWMVTVQAITYPYGIEPSEFALLQLWLPRQPTSRPPSGSASKNNTLNIYEEIQIGRVVHVNPSVPSRKSSRGCDTLRMSISTSISSLNPLNAPPRVHMHVSHGQAHRIRSDVDVTTVARYGTAT